MVVATFRTRRDQRGQRRSNALHSPVTLLRRRRDYRAPSHQNARLARIFIRSIYADLPMARRLLGVLLNSDFNARAVGTQLLLPHPYGIQISRNASIGSRCTIFQHVTIGESHGTMDGSPRIEDDVVIGANAVLIGPIVVGKNSVVGAGTVLTTSVPPDSIAVGVPGRVIRQNKPRG